MFSLVQPAKGLCDLVLAVSPTTPTLSHWHSLQPYWPLCGSHPRLLHMLPLWLDPSPLAPTQAVPSCIDSTISSSEKLMLTSTSKRTTLSLSMDPLPTALFFLVPCITNALDCFHNGPQQVTVPGTDPIWICLSDPGSEPMEHECLWCTG